LPAPRMSLSDLPRVQPTRFAGQKSGVQSDHPKREMQADELRKALSDALGGAKKDSAGENSDV